MLGIGTWTGDVRAKTDESIAGSPSRYTHLIVLVIDSTQLMCAITPPTITNKSNEGAADFQQYEEALPTIASQVTHHGSRRSPPRETDRTGQIGRYGTRRTAKTSGRKENSAS